MRKLIEKVSVGLMSLAFLLVGSSVFAAADTDLTNSLASTTAMATDNKGIILTFLVSIGVVVLVIAVAKGGINWAIAKIVGSIGGRRRKK